MYIYIYIYIYVALWIRKIQPTESGQSSIATSKNPSVMNNIKEIIINPPGCKGWGFQLWNLSCKKVMDRWKDRQKWFRVFKYDRSLSNIF